MIIYMIIIQYFQTLPLKSFPVFQANTSKTPYFMLIGKTYPVLDQNDQKQ